MSGHLKRRVENTNEIVIFNYCLQCRSPIPGSANIDLGLSFIGTPKASVLVNAVVQLPSIPIVSASITYHGG